MLHWKNGEEWFFDTLVDADVGSNSAGWQWISGCGADASPYFRIFNPILQGQKFDPDGDYVKEFVPELNNIPKNIFIILGRCLWRIKRNIILRLVLHIQHQL